MNIRLPTEVGEALRAATPDVFTTLNWIVAHLFILHPKQKPPPLHIVAGDREVSAEELRVWDTTYVTVAGSKMVRHIRRESHGGPQLFVHPLPGLFGFMRYIIWPRLFDGRQTEFLENEQLLNDEEQRALDQQRVLAAEVSRLIGPGAERLLAKSPALFAQYNAASARSRAHLTTVSRLANQRYSQAFQDFCLSPQLVAVQARLFDEDPENYAASVKSFVEEQRALLATRPA